MLYIANFFDTILFVDLYLPKGRCPVLGRRPATPVIRLVVTAGNTDDKCWLILKIEPTQYLESGPKPKAQLTKNNVHSLAAFAVCSHIRAFRRLASPLVDKDLIRKGKR